LQLRARNRGIAIHEAFEPGLPRLWADERAVRQIWPQPALQRDQVHAARRRGLAQGRLDRGRRAIHERQGQWPGIPDDEIPIVLASFGQGTNAIKSAETGHRPWPADRQETDRPAWRDVHAQIQAALRTEVIVTFQPERVMSALGPLEEPSPPIQPQHEQASVPRAGRPSAAPAKSPGLRSAPWPLCSGRIEPLAHDGDHLPLHQGLHHRPAIGALPRLRPHAQRDRAMDVAREASGSGIMAELPSGSAQTDWRNRAGR